MLPVKLIVCPTDFSPPACSCVGAASELAEHFGAELLLVNVVPALPSLPPDPNYVFKIPEYAQFIDPKFSEQLMSESMPDEDLPSMSLPRKNARARRAS